MIPRKQLQAIAAAVQGIPVWGCLKGSPTPEAGVRYGDIVLVVNGVRTLSVDDYVEARKLRKDGVDLEILRDGRELTLHLSFRPANTTTLGELAEQVVEGRYLDVSATPETTKGSPN